MKTAFGGFPREGLQFFRGLRKNNTREWFQPRKEVFEKHVKAPMLELVDAINQELRKFAPDHITDPKKAIFRIYRDTRFSSDKTPYKDRIAASFSRRGMEKLGGAGFYFSVNDKGVEVAAGVYHPSPEAMLAVRSHIAATHEQFRRHLANKKLRTLMGELGGAELSRVPKGFDAAHPAADLIKKKDWVFYVTLEDPKIAGTSAILTDVVSRFRAVAPVIEYLNTPLKSRKPKNDPLANYF